MRGRWAQDRRSNLISPDHLISRSTLALATWWSSSHDACFDRDEPLICFFLHFDFKFDLCRLEDDHVTATLLALAAHPPMLADAGAATLLADAAPPPVLADGFAAALLAAAAVPPVLADAFAAALLAAVALPPVLADAAATALLADAALPPVLANAGAAAILAPVALPAVLADAGARAALLAPAALPPVLADAGAAAILAPAALPPVLANAGTAALLADAAPPPVRAGHLASRPPAARLWRAQERSKFVFSHEITGRCQSHKRNPYLCLIINAPPRRGATAARSDASTAPSRTGTARTPPFFQ